MSVRSFTVFQDTPIEISKISNICHDNAQSSSMTSDTTLLSTFATTEKENLHPVTGERAGPASAAACKKRKTGVLVTKVLVAPSKKQKEHSEPKKERKVLGSKGKSNEGRKSSSSKKSTRSTRKASPLPKVEEEQELQRELPRLSVNQTDIDSKCYELTVSPLADVSEAYDTTPQPESQEQDISTDKAQSVEPEIRDYFSPSPSNATLPSERQNTPTEYTTDTETNVTFTTPERKRIYSSFTFSSPSPSSERFKQAHSPTRRDSATANSE
ncbi:hypothetical protein BJ138DRAFT_1180420 [Hygrophoropsis aurantiaca]|uniref:Uncharacterized protein n=1 Tax=Hygrophoropsis aurantiaca TaxID=72124 RepID=A0ACB8AB33_9AGAM|nr:hypothetical protein BJ138DRAFT_1180420 [Hygrophoropsis aurantiaca]